MTALWLFTVKYYQTASDIDCFLRKSTSPQINRKKKMRLKVATGSLLVACLLSYIPLDISVFLSDENLYGSKQDYMCAIIAILSSTFLVMLIIT